MTIKDLTYFLHLKHKRNYDYYIIRISSFLFYYFLNQKIHLFKKIKISKINLF